MKGMKNRVLAFVLAFVMVIANVMTVAAAEGEEPEKSIGVGVDAYGGTYSKSYWDWEKEQWVSDGEVDDTWSYLLVSDGCLRNANMWRIDKDPIKEGATFEGWAKFYEKDLDGDGALEKIYEPKTETEPYYTTDEMFDDKFTEYDVTYAAKWSDLAIETYYQFYMVDFLSYGDNCVFKYLTSEWNDEKQEYVWVDGESSFGTTVYAGLPLRTQLEQDFQIKEDPTREGATFEGWAKFKYEDGVCIFMPQSTSDPYYTTDEMLDSTMPAYWIEFVPKWSDIPIEDYYPTYFETVLNANGGKVSYSYCGMGDGEEARIDEYESTVHTLPQTARKSVSDLLKENESNLLGINKSGEVLQSWTLYQIGNLEYTFCEEGDTVPKTTEDQIALLYHTETWEGGTSYVYLILEGCKKVADNVSTDKIINDYKGANYYAVANWKKSVALVENQQVTESLTKEGKDLVAKIKDLKEDDTSLEKVVSKQTIDNVKFAIGLGQTIKTELAVYPVQETLVDAKEKTSIESEVSKKLGKDLKIQYLDIQVMLKADEQKLGNILTLKDAIKVTIAIPDDMKAEDGKYVVLRNHDGKVDVLNTTLNSDGTVTFETDKFSTYALAYVPATSQAAPAEPAPTPETPATTVPAVPKTGDASAIALYSALCILALAVVVVKKKEFFVK